VNIPAENIAENIAIIEKMPKIIRIKIQGCFSRKGISKFSIVIPTPRFFIEYWIFSLLNI